MAAAAEGIATTAGPPNAVVEIQPGMQVQPVVLVNSSGQYVTTDSSVLTTEGDMLFENAAPAPARLPIGSSGQVLTVSAGLPAWENAGSGSGTVTSVTATDTSIVVSGTDTVAPTIATGTLDVIATQHPPAASWSNNSHAITAVSDLAVSGLTGATAASRYAGATTSGAPASGTFAVGDYVVDQTGVVWICTTAGTPGTWTSAAALALPLSGGTMSGAIAMGSHKITGLTNGSGAQDAAAYGQTPAGGLALTSASLLAGLITPYVKQITGVTASATANTFGTGVTMSADAGFSGLLACQMNFVTTSVNTGSSETLTLQSTVTYTSNATYANSNITTFTTNATASAGLGTIMSMIGYAGSSSDGLIIKSIEFQTKSNLSSSTASLTVNIVGLNLP